MRWLTEQEFTEVLSLSQFLPGPNIVNASVIIGRRFRGPLGSVVAPLGLMLMPIAVVLLLAAVFAEFAEVEAVRGACRGISAAASGLVLAMALRMAQPIRRTAWQVAIAPSSLPRSASPGCRCCGCSRRSCRCRWGSRWWRRGMISPVLLELALQFLVLSLLSIGGANAIIPEMHLRAVEVEHWMTDADFSQMFALSQAAPGPNVLIVSLIGWKVAGVAGALVAMAAMCGPSSLLTYYVAHVWDRFRDAPLRIAIQRALAPVTVGLILASGYVLTRATDHAWPAYAVTGATLVAALTTRLHPLWMLAAGAALGVLGLV